ncbi:DUF5915 domain-containing protein [Nocardia sp. NBC_01327]|uniref:DUF5915 domain-containing protein n=1 Tax=Nocardia sp. NBC_01327 TaxID=2903593 RepID=UPI002E0E0B02|nr:DUF5915 domain-containing protein [Nocardia sp. NBC_01327]
MSSASSSARRDAGLYISDSIIVTIASSTEVRTAVLQHQALIADETLAEEIFLVSELDDGYCGTAGSTDLLIHIDRTS